MDFRDLLKQRRMVRHYEPEAVPRETLERICRTVRRAPSGGFSQGQRLIVVTDAEMRAPRYPAASPTSSSGALARTSR